MELVISTSAARPVQKSTTVKGADLTSQQRVDVVALLTKYLPKNSAIAFTKGKTKTQINVKFGKVAKALELSALTLSPKGKIEKVMLRHGETQKSLVIGLVAETKFKLNGLINAWFKGTANFEKLPTAPKAKPVSDKVTTEKAPKAKADPKPKTTKAEPAPVKHPAKKPVVKTKVDHKVPNPHKAGKTVQPKVGKLVTDAERMSRK